MAGAGLQNSAHAKRTVCDGPSRTVIDGPFTETRELVAGFSIWEVKDMDEALAWAKRSLNPTSGPSEIEIRPFYEAADLAEFLTPEELSTPREGESPDTVGWLLRRLPSVVGGAAGCCPGTGAGGVPGAAGVCRVLRASLAQTPNQALHLPGGHVALSRAHSAPPAGEVGR